MPNTIDNTPDWMIIDAVRYATGRMTSQVCTTCHWLVDHWNEIPEQARHIIQTDIEYAFKRDDVSRNTDKLGSHALGMACDRKEWEAVRELWRENNAED